MMLRVKENSTGRLGTVVSWYTNPSSDSWATIAWDDGEVGDLKVGYFKAAGWRTPIDLGLNLP